MSRERLYIIHGMGSDAVGLVGAITTPLSKAGGNVVDLRQDVLHGLFTLYMVVDLAESSLRIDDLRQLTASLSEETGLNLAVDPYVPVARNPDKKNVLLTVIGPDRPGIIASVSAALGKYHANIELAQSVGREGLFLMELLTDISRCSIPVTNLISVLGQQMAAMNTQLVVQTEDVFNKKKRVILFDIASSLMPAPERAELLQLTGIDGAELAELYSVDSKQACVAKAAALLDGFSLEIMNAIVADVRATPDTMELVQTLKTMGYKVALAATACTLLTERVRERLGLDYAFGVAFGCDDDARAFTGEIEPDGVKARSPERTTAELMQRERLSATDITVLSDSPGGGAPGFKLHFDLEAILNLHNDRLVSKEQLRGIVGSFGIPG